MKIISILGVASLVAVSVHAYANAGNTKTNDDDKIICKRIPEPGTRIGGKKACKTAKEWKQDRAILRQAIEEQRNKGIPPE